LRSQLEDMSLYWGDEDVDIMGDFAVKTFKNIASENGEDIIFPMYNGEEDAMYANELFALTVAHLRESNDLIDYLVQAERWDAERIVFMDRLIMCMALTEFQGFLSIPTRVTLNEYIELAKNFSTEGSGGFVNGILHAALGQLRAEGKVVKP